ncbi:phosphonate ABC transporter ATP-binding protein [Candidatus Cyanaurora vandensis]|uniref:phosphonate ABC transporter ATP-binding protein n=1 Tax=Candidatus Cyanaurora vandensis TaxID=2714958 RepID=UPI00257DC48F|nr:ATP-binding cassette domain-containing protein [Candidatus Cyanaurora vandensis]
MPKSNPSPAIECRGVVVRLGGRAVLEGLDLTIHQGESVVLLGLNGAGKSTLLRAMAGLVPLAAGTIQVLGQPILSHPSSPIAMLAQGGGLIPQLSALENVLCGRLGQLGTLSTLWGFPLAERKRARELLLSLGLGECLQTPVRQLSGGQQQRVAIARALIASAQILLADEPVTGLDVLATRQVMQTLDQLAAAGLTLVSVLHDLELAQAHAGRAVLLEAGKITYDGPCHNLGQYFTPVTREVSAA